MVDLQEWYTTALAKAAGFTPYGELDWYDDLPRQPIPDWPDGEGTKSNDQNLWMVVGGWA
ncbi:hypothetical protein [Lapillicoccus sp.]|uniref:hypothetical protein n=1 Tax=Lapillicoccus sp. TaxID=1909287 RepID=UPI0025D92558|nr:hypothetical protein [Lapillicoccus sp.]